MGSAACDSHERDLILDNEGVVRNMFEQVLSLGHIHLPATIATS